VPLPTGLPDLARILRFGAGVIRSRTLPGGEMYHFRTYSSAGALYPVELYLACPELTDLSAGLYHFHPGELSLRRLRAGDVRANLAHAAADSALADARAVLLLSGIMWRSAWKYGARAYRHLFWDAGTMLANLLALAASEGLSRRLLTGFVDSELNHILGLDGDREAAIALLALGRAERAEQPSSLAPLELESVPLSRTEPVFEDARGLHAASVLASPEEVQSYRTAAPETLESGAEAGLEPLETVLRRRGSVREFSADPVPVDQLAATLALAAAPVPADVAPSNELYGIVNAVEGLESGVYRFEPPDVLELLRPGAFRLQAGYLVLEQYLGSLAAATFFLMTDLERVLETLGDRGYRATELEAGIRVGRIYLASYAQGLAATASTFYDDDVSSFLAPSLSPMLCAAVGFPA
jgi:SagB-type dehydrogenase family enzyme